MKTRDGYVSNSSSSSFLLCTKKSLRGTNKKKFMEMLGFKEGTAATAICRPIIDHLYNTHATSLKEQLEVWGYKTVKEAIEENGPKCTLAQIASMLEADWDVREVKSSSDSDTAANAYFYGFTPDSDSADVKFIKLC